MKFLKINLVALLVVSLLSCQKKTVDKDPVQKNVDQLEAIFDQVNEDFDNPNAKGVEENLAMEDRVALIVEISMKDGKIVGNKLEYFSEETLQWGLGFAGATEDLKKDEILLDEGFGNDDAISIINKSDLNSILDKIKQNKDKTLWLIMRK